VGNIGRALLSHFSTKDSSFDIVAAFDTDPSVVHRVICGVHCYPMSEFEERVFPHPVRVGVICTPEEHAQGVADQMVRLGIRGILNFATVALRLPEHVTVEDMPISLLLKKLTILSQ
jgi:redox-sensing transcriptional repressor